MVLSSQSVRRLSTPTMFEFPKIHSFPPFYTKQRNATILENQLDAWCLLILAYCEHYRVYSLLPVGAALSLQDPGELPSFFENKEIDRTVLDDFRRTIFNHLIHKLGRAAYVDPKKQDAGILIYWRTLAEWAKILHDHVESTGQLGTILTVYELTRLEDSAVDENLRNIDSNLFKRILEVLMKQGKAQILPGEEAGEIGGVKIV